jgi:4'-phosphopantetheinyl transferase
MRLYYTISKEISARDLLKRAIDKRAADGRPYVIAYKEHGKPYFVNSDIFFNYSHCKYGAACIVANQEVGVDIQDIKSVRPAVIKRVCNDCEISSIKTDEDFIRIWTMKEAYAKFTGKGFAEGFKSIDTANMTAVKIGNCYISWYSQNGEVPELIEIKDIL